MKNNSRSVTSSQTGLHPKLIAIVQKHQHSVLRSPIAAHTAASFAASQQWLTSKPQRPLLLDSGCGTGMSTTLLAQRHPEHNVIGVDRSISRLEKTAALTDSGLKAIADNACLVQADLVDFWRLAAAAGWQLSQHSILYPNPYPKPSQFKHRWHGHAVFPVLLALGGTIELRSNWRIYLEEFVAAAALTKQPELNDRQLSVLANEHVETLNVDEPLTLFEKKYRDSGQLLYRATIRL